MLFGMGYMYHSPAAAGPKRTSRVLWTSRALRGNQSRATKCGFFGQADDQTVPCICDITVVNSVRSAKCLEVILTRGISCSR